MICVNRWGLFHFFLWKTQFSTKKTETWPECYLTFIFFPTWQKFINHRYIALVPMLISLKVYCVLYKHVITFLPRVCLCVQTLSSNRGIRSMWWRWRCSSTVSERWGKPLPSTWSLMKTWWPRLRSGMCSCLIIAKQSHKIPFMEGQLVEKIMRWIAFFISDLTQIYPGHSLWDQGSLLQGCPGPENSSTLL